MAVRLDDAAMNDVKKAVAAALCMRAKRIGGQMELQRDLQRPQSSTLQESATKSHEEQLAATSFVLAAAVCETSHAIFRERWSYQRNENWFEDTLPNLGEANFKQAFRVSQTTFRYIVESCRPVLERQDTTMRKAISTEKRVAIGLYKLCSTAEDRTVAHLFGQGRSTVNTIFRQFVRAVIEMLEAEWIRMVSRKDMAAHLREFFAVTGFPHALGAMDGCHFPISPPKEHASDYHNYKGW